MPFALPPTHGARSALPVRQLALLPGVADALDGLYGEDFVNQEGMLWDAGPEDEWAYGELEYALGSGSGYTPARYAWRMVLPTGELTWEYVSDTRGEGDLGDYAILLGAPGSGSGSGLGIPGRYLLRRAHPGYWVAIGVADGIGNTGDTAAYPVVGCLRLPTRLLTARVDAQGVIRTSGSGLTDSPGYWLTEAPTARVTTLGLDPRTVTPVSACYAPVDCCGSGSGEDAGSGSGGGDPVLTACCETPVPHTLYLSAHQTSGTLCADASVSITLAYDSSADAWTGTATTAGGVTYQGFVQCVAGTWVGTLKYLASGTYGCITNDPVTLVACSPFQLTWDCAYDNSPAACNKCPLALSSVTVTE